MVLCEHHSVGSVASAAGGWSSYALGDSTTGSLVSHSYSWSSKKSSTLVSVLTGDANFLKSLLFLQ